MLHVSMLYCLHVEHMTSNVRALQSGKVQQDRSAGTIRDVELWRLDAYCREE